MTRLTAEDIDAECRDISNELAAIEHEPTRIEHQTSLAALEQAENLAKWLAEAGEADGQRAAGTALILLALGLSMSADAVGLSSPMVGAHYELMRRIGYYLRTGVS